MLRSFPSVLGIGLILAANGVAPANLAEQTTGETPPLRLSDIFDDNAASGYTRALEVRVFEFPRDHGPHPDYRHEWWYVTGNLDGPAAERFGFELTLFRLALVPEPVAEHVVPSAWGANHIYMGHFTITDVAEQKFYVAQRYARGAAGLAGAESDPVRIWVEDWSMSADDEDRWRLYARDDRIEADLEFTPLKPPVLNGDRGLSQKADEAGNANYYYSIPRLETDGVIRIGQRTYPVSGLAWLDREWGTSVLGEDQQGWDWFALQLSDGTELMFYSLRKVDGSQDTHSAGTWIDERGTGRKLLAEDVEIEVLGHWQSPLGGRYPSGWRLRLPGLDMELRIEPVMAAQELDTRPRYWEGAVNVNGTRAGGTVDGRGYVELTGYAE